MSMGDEYFEQMFANSDDPWAMRKRWYERRKRALLLACLPREHYPAIFEPGCANGETSLVLAPRCDYLLCCDTAPAAVQLTRGRLADINHAQVRQWRLPQDWPNERFDLIVLNELCYYLDPTDLDQLIERAGQSLKPSGHLLACHWLAPIDGCSFDGAAVHRRLDEGLGLCSVLRHEEPDFILQVWSRDGVSVAQQEGLR